MWAAASEWLMDWVEDALQSSLQHIDKNWLATVARNCRAAAQSAGFGEEQLQNAAGGDLEGYLREWQAVLADPDLTDLCAD